MDPLISQLIPGPQLSRFLKQFPELKLELITRDRLAIWLQRGLILPSDSVILVHRPLLPENSSTPGLIEIMNTKQARAVMYSAMIGT
jgi:hypothetical protein